MTKVVAKRWCTRCNGEISQIDIVDMVGKQSACARCSRLEWGYTKEQEPLAKILQKHLTEEQWKITDILRDINAIRKS